MCECVCILSISSHITQVTQREKNEGATCRTSVIRLESEKLCKPSVVTGQSEIILLLETRDRNSSLYSDVELTDCRATTDCC